MLKSDLLESWEIFGGVQTLIDALSSPRGSDFLRTKSYRVIEQILVSDGTSFENAAAVLTTESAILLAEGHPPHTIKANRNHLGQIDNIFNYLNVGGSSPVDAHTFLEKVRIVQLLWDTPMPDQKLTKEMVSTFGYGPWNQSMLVKLMLKTGFLAAEVDRGSESLEIQLRSTAKGKLCITSLVGNLAYIEHVFHKTLFPSVLIEHISDKARDPARLEWPIASIRNAFIFLTYFRHIEANKAKGVAVPEQYRLFEQARRRVVTSLERMTSAFDWHDPLNRDGPADRGSGARAAAICSGALKEIEQTLKAWRNAGVVMPVRNVA
jgi:hypothetical protein